jgi:hypothetical protein
MKNAKFLKLERSLTIFTAFSLVKTPERSADGNQLDKMRDNDRHPTTTTGDILFVRQ